LLSKKLRGSEKQIINVNADEEVCSIHRGLLRSLFPIPEGLKMLLPLHNGKILLQFKETTLEVWDSINGITKTNIHHRQDLIEKAPGVVLLHGSRKISKFDTNNK
jgi:hypothetical protein